MTEWSGLFGRQSVSPGEQGSVAESSSGTNPEPICAVESGLKDWLRRLWQSPKARPADDDATIAEEKAYALAAAAAQARDAHACADQILHFTIGPVQEFIAEARRTRDLWAGSFLLSWLTGQAMVAVEDNPPYGLGGTIEFPYVTDDCLYQAIKSKGRKPSEYDPSLTNRFVARVSAHVTPEDIRDKVTRRVYEKWRLVAEAVWRRFIASAPFDGTEFSGTREIWDRQIGKGDDWPFWEIAWVLGPHCAPDQDRWLEQRKTWRIFDTASEPGDMCVIMGRYQELSGFVRSKDRLKQNEFWIKIRGSISQNLWEVTDEYIKLLELHGTERLCAVAFVKRLFPRLHPQMDLEKVIGWLPPSHNEHIVDYRARTGRDPKRLLGSYRPSTAFVAATHWIARAALAERHAKLFRNVVADESKVHRALAVAERYKPLPCHQSCRDFAETDARLFYKFVLLVKKKEPGIKSDAARDELGHVLKALYRAELPKGKVYRRPSPTYAHNESARSSAAPEMTVGEPSSYYALLRMDGDGTSSLICEATDRIKEPLAHFTNNARTIVAAHNGSVIYAGGDDLLALLPVEDVLPAANSVRCDYENLVGAVAKFADRGTISASIVFAHHEASLGGVLRRSQRLLNHVAKEQNGRASLALAIHRTDSAGPEWASTWDWRDAGVDSPIAADLHELARRGRSLVSTGQTALPSTYGVISNRFVYGVSRRLRAFFSAPNQTASELPGDIDLIPLLRAVGGEGAQLIADDDFKRLLRLIKPQRRKLKNGSYLFEPDKRRLSLEGLLVLRFLASEWRRIETS